MDLFYDSLYINVFMFLRFYAFTLLRFLSFSPYQANRSLLGCVKSEFYVGQTKCRNKIHFSHSPIPHDSPPTPWVPDKTSHKTP